MHLRRTPKRNLHRRQAVAGVEPLEPRLALAASYSFLDQSGNVVTIATSKGTNAQLAQSLSFTAQGMFLSHLDGIQLTDPAFAGTSLTITAKTANNLPATAAIGAISSAFPFGAVAVGGDIVSLSANTSQPETFAGSAVASLHVRSIGAVAVAGTSSIHGGMGGLKIDGSLNGGAIKARSIASVAVGGSLVGTATNDSGSIQCLGAIAGPVTVGGSVLGGAGGHSGSIFAKSLGAVSLGGSLQGGGGFMSGSVAAAKMGKVTLSGNIVGGTVASSGLVWAVTGTIGGVTVQGSIIGNDGDNSGMISAHGAIGPVVIGKSLVGGKGISSGSIQSDAGSIAGVTVSLSAVGWTGSMSGAIRAPAGGIGPVTLSSGSLVGGSGDEAGTIYAKYSIGQVTIGQNVIGASGPSSGTISSFWGKVAGIDIGGSVTHGSGYYAGSIEATSGFGNISIGGDFLGKGIYSELGDIPSLSIKGSLAASVFVEDGTIGSVTVGGNLGDGTDASFVIARHLGTVKVSGDVNGGLIGAGPGGISSVTIGGSLRGAAGVGRGAIDSDGGPVGSVTIGGDVIGGSDPFSGSIRGASVGPVTARSLQGGKGDNSGCIDSDGSLGIVTISGGISGGAGANSGAIRATGSIAGIKVGLYVAGGAGSGSASIRTDRILKSLSVTGGVTGFGPEPLLITAAGNKGAVAMPSIAIGGALTRACVLAGYASTSTAVVNGAARIGTVSLGSLSASSIVAAATSNDFPNFGDGQDTAAGVTGVPAIASIVIAGDATGSGDPTETFGLVASSFGSITKGGQKQFLNYPHNTIVGFGTMVGGVGNLFIRFL